MLIPWASDDIRETIWAISYHSQEHFHREDYLLLKSLADFASIAPQASPRAGVRDAGQPALPPDQQPIEPHT